VVLAVAVLVGALLAISAPSGPARPSPDAAHAITR
jgi:hypothetical protein